MAEPKGRAVILNSSGQFARDPLYYPEENFVCDICNEGRWLPSEFQLTRRGRKFSFLTRICLKAHREAQSYIFCCYAPEAKINKITFMQFHYVQACPSCMRDGRAEYASLFSGKRVKPKTSRRVWLRRSFQELADFRRVACALKHRTRSPSAAQKRSSRYSPTDQH